MWTIHLKKQTKNSYDVCVDIGHKYSSALSHLIKTKNPLRKCTGLIKWPRRTFR